MVQRKIFIIFIIFILLGFALGITYSFIIGFVKTNDIDLSKTGKLEVIYINEEDIDGSLQPTNSKESGLSTIAKIKIAEGSVAALATISLEIESLPVELAVSGLKWEVYKNSDISTYNQGTFEGVSEGEFVDIVSDYLLSTDETTFTIYIWLNGNEVGNEVENKTFTAYLSARATTAS